MQKRAIPCFDRSAKFFEGVDFVKSETPLRSGRSELWVRVMHPRKDNDGSFTMLAMLRGAELQSWGLSFARGYPGSITFCR
jgi:hypothetical protein